MNKPKLRISTQKANITFFFEKEEEADHLFENLMSQVIGHSKKDFSNKPDKEKYSEPIRKNLCSPEGVKGFVYLMCPECGYARGYNLKSPQSSFYCLACHNEFLLDNLYEMKVQCKCGASFGYRTNMNQDVFEVPCLRCGNPVPIVYNNKKGIYQTMQG